MREGHLLEDLPKNGILYTEHEYLQRWIQNRLYDRLLSTSEVVVSHDGYYDISSLEIVFSAFVKFDDLKLVKINTSTSLREKTATSYFCFTNHDGTLFFYAFWNRTHVGVEVIGIKGDSLYHKILETLDKLQTSRENSQFVYSVVKKYDELAFEQTFDIGNEQLVTSNYSDYVIEGYNACVEMLCSKNTDKGRLIIVDGPPGTGKTHFIKGLITKCSDKTAFALVKPDAIEHMLSPDFIITIQKFKNKIGPSTPITFIIEDADNVIAPRDTGNISALSELLNLTDGLAGKSLDLRVIATTNAKETDVDDAILRPGRLAARVEIRELSIEESNVILERLESSERAVEPMTLAEIYAAARGQKTQFKREKKNKKIGF